MVIPVALLLHHHSGTPPSPMEMPRNSFSDEVVGRRSLSDTLPASMIWAMLGPRQELSFGQKEALHNDERYKEAALGLGQSRNFVFGERGAID